MKIENLVFSGGGIKGLSFIGCLQYLEESKLINDIKCISGTSIGSLFATLLTIGYTSYEIKNIFLNIDFNTLQNINLFSINKKYGLDTGEKFINFIKVLFKEKNISENITFKELYNKFKIDLIITGTNISKQKIEYFNYKNNPDMEIIIAVRISISVPIVYEYVKYNDNLYVDGGILDDYPIHIFKNNIENTIGFLIYNYNKSIDISTFDEYIYSFLFCLLKKVNKLKKEVYIKNTILLEQDKIGFLDIEINKDEKNELINLGYKRTKNYFIYKKDLEESKKINEINLLLDIINN
tara:strand:+ start:227 stop:1111 length:885 start_codon:yes stop_codon:yes gene_type:complete